MTGAERKRRFDAICRLGCIVCRLKHEVHTPPAIHHLLGIKYRATGKKANDRHTIGLCGPHHQTGGYGIAVHAGVKEWERRYGTQEFLLELTDRLIERMEDGIR